MHPSIPLNDEAGTRLTSDEIHQSAVKEAYEYCYAHGLAQTWAYLWNCWYCPVKWPLWARAASVSIPVLRTTMLVESFWKHFKHGTLHKFNNPRLDLVIYHVLTRVIPTIHIKLDYHLGTSRPGRPKALAPWQEDFDATWRKLSLSDAELHTLAFSDVGKRNKTRSWKQERLEQLIRDQERKKGTYHTSLIDWTCSCPSFLISRFLLCKHLVRAANSILCRRMYASNEEPYNNRLPRRDLLYLRRHRCTPFFRIAGIHEEATPLPTNEIILPASRPPTPDLESNGGSDSDDQSESPSTGEPLTFLENPHPDDSPHALDDSTPVELDGVAKIDGLGRVCF